MNKCCILLMILLSTHCTVTAPFESHWQEYKNIHSAMFFGEPVGCFPFMFAFTEVAYLGWKLVQMIDVKMMHPVEPLVQQFVEDTLSEVGYTQAEIKKLKVTNNRRLECLECSDKAIILCLNDEVLNKAIELEKAKTGYTILDQGYYNDLKRWYPHFPTDDLLLLLAAREKAITPDSIALLKLKIVKQAYKVLHSSDVHDLLASCMRSASAAYLASYLHEQNKNFFSLYTIPAFFPCAISCWVDVYNLRKNFKRVDVDVIRRFYKNDPHVIHTYIKLLKVYRELDHHSSWLSRKVVQFLRKIGDLDHEIDRIESVYELLEHTT